MKRTLHLFSSLLLIFICSAANAQNTYWTEYFDNSAAAAISGSSSTPTTGTVALGTGSWQVNSVFRAGSGCTPTDPVQTTSAKGVRLPKNTVATSPPASLITPTLSNGVNTVTWKNVKTATTPSASSALSIYYSVDNGATWILAAAPFTTSVACDQYSVTINNASANRIKVTNETNSDQDIDIITITSVTPLPVTFMGLTAAFSNGTVKLNWQTATESNIAAYIIERSSNTKDFSVVASVPVKENATGSVKYSSVDNTPLAGESYYRIKAIELDGKVTYTNTIKVKATAGTTEIVIAPNPVRNGELNVQLSGVVKGDYTLRVINNVGQIVFSSKLSTEGGSLTQAFRLPTTVKAGLYTLQVAGNDVNLNRKIVIE